MKTKITFGMDDVIIQGMFYCPFGKESQSCFFHWLQMKNTHDKISWFSSLTIRDKQDLLYCHLKCSCKTIISPRKVKYFQNN